MHLCFLLYLVRPLDYGILSLPAIATCRRVYELAVGADLSRPPPIYRPLQLVHISSQKSASETNTPGEMDSTIA